MRALVATATVFLATTSASVAADSLSLTGDSSAIKNEDAALLLGYAGARTAEGFSRYASRSPIVWARYNPGQGIGHVLVARAIPLPDGSTQVRVSAFAPRDGERFANGGDGQRVRYFGGVNPFGQFDSGDGYFRSINFTAFLACVGLVMRSAQASIAFVYYPVLTSTESIRATGGELSWSSSASATYKVEGRWLVGAPAESGDRRGLVPSYRVSGCDPGADPRNGCRVAGFATFVAWDAGNLPGASSPYLSRTGDGTPDVGAMRAAFAGLEGYLRDSSLWADATWNLVSGLNSGNAALRNEAAGLASGQLDRRDRVVTSNGASLEDGRITASPASIWNPADVVTPDYIAKPLTDVAGGLGAVSTAASWSAGRDRALTQDVLTHRAGLPVIRP